MGLPISLLNIGLVLCAGFIGALLAKSMRLPVLAGYLFGGLVVGVATGGQLTSDDFLMGLAEFGVAMLMFSLGIEVSFANLKSSGVVIVVATLLQVFLTVSLTIVAAVLLGQSFPSAFFLGAALSLSSTAVVIKILEDNGHLGTTVGEISITWMLVQDMLIVPFFFFLPLLAGNTFSAGSILILILKTAAIFLFVVLLGRRMGRIFLSGLDRTNSIEIIILGLIVWVIASVTLSVWLGLTMTLGAFLAGVMIGGNDHETFTLALTRPIRDLFAAIFFTSLGLFLSPQALASLLIPTLLGVAAILIVKFVISLLILLFFGYHLRLALDVAGPISGVGEFAFLIMSLGLSLNTVNPDIFMFTVSVVLFSIAATPAFTWVVRKLFSLSPRLTLAKHPLYQSTLSGHVIVCGFGRVGFWVGEALKRQGINFTVIDYHHQAIKLAHQMGVVSIYGDATEPDILLASGIKTARAIVVTTPDFRNQERIIKITQGTNKSAYLIARAFRESDKRQLKELGANSVIQPEFEAALSIIHRILQEIGVDRSTVADTVKSIRAQADTISTDSKEQDRH